MLYRVRGAILIGIFLTSIVSWPRPTAVTYFPHTEAGDQLFNYFKQVVTFHSIDKVGNAIAVSGTSFLPHQCEDLILR
jgi:AGZA family xanthine/uracil permease-like MFS transporter